MVVLSVFGAQAGVIFAILSAPKPKVVGSIPAARTISNVLLPGSYEVITFA